MSKKQSSFKTMHAMDIEKKSVQHSPTGRTSKGRLVIPVDTLPSVAAHFTLHKSYQMMAIFKVHHKHSDHTVTLAAISLI